MIKPLESSLSEEELHELDEFLCSPEIEDTSMDVSTMEGFFAAIALSPQLVMPSTWMPWLWDMDEGETAPEFSSQAEASHVMGLVMRRYNEVVRQILDDPAHFEPIYLAGAQWGAAEWCEGFLLGMTMDQDSWAPLMIGEPVWFAPFMRLGTEDGMRLVKKDRDAQRWMDEVVPSLVKLHAFWKEHRNSRLSGPTPDSFAAGNRSHRPIVRIAPKVGRNDPCLCGSGKKYKKCCGSGQPELH